MFNGAHVVLFSKDSDADRALLGKLLNGRPVDAGDGWLIFPLPPAEVAVHPEHGSIRHELHLMCDDIETARKALAEHGIESKEPEDLGYGIVSSFRMPGGADVGFYQPRHARAN